jgi:hypothetical protein
MQQNGKVHFPTQKQLVKKHIPFVLAKCMDHCVLHALAQCDTISITFDLWMNRIRFDTFVFIVNFLDWDWVPCHATIDLFEATYINGIALVKLMKPLLIEFQLIYMVLTCVKDEGKNLATLNFALVYCCVLRCSSIGKTLFWHMFWTRDVKGLSVCYE